MKVVETTIGGLVIIEPKIHEDERGYFFESWNNRKFNELVANVNFVQDNQSCSSKNTLRGLHFQNPPHAQGKLVRVISGSILDVAVDIRKSSPTYGKHFSVLLSKENNKMFYIPPGFAHGFLALEDDTIMSYKCTEDYNKESEGSLFWDDKDLNIDWSITNPLISEKDDKAESFKSFISLF
jgi:dTDP-4-dehydrorhamnose 3,5-epimerase|tara:strand:- start:3977 stop:4519 length:543 start_codon:yes stop_codon:yes gene_type:complete